MSTLGTRAVEAGHPHRTGDRAVAAAADTTSVARLRRDGGAAAAAHSSVGEEGTAAARPNGEEGTAAAVFLTTEVVMIAMDTAGLIAAMRPLGRELPARHTTGPMSAMAGAAAKAAAATAAGVAGEEAARATGVAAAVMSTTEVLVAVDMGPTGAAPPLDGKGPHSTTALSS
jgi:hypothetical protein